MGKIVAALALLCVVSGLATGPARAVAETLTVAVAANFLSTAERLSGPFEAQSGHELILVSGSSGKLAAQIIAGAPYDVILSADQKSIDELIGLGKADRDSRITYAAGRLALWSADPRRLAGDGEAVLRGGAFRHLAMANPALAPYGRAARETLDALGLGEALADRIVLGENVAQVFGMIAKGGVELGFVALSQVVAGAWRDKGSRWIVPEGLHRPILQDGSVVTASANQAAARAFLDYLRSQTAVAIITATGYSVPGRAVQ